MDTNTLIAIVIALFAAIVIAALIIFRQRAKVNIKGPFGTGLGVEATNEQPQSAPGVQITDAKAKKGSIRATTEMGDGVALTRVKAGEDIIATNKQPPKDGTPKARRRQ